MNDDHKTQAQAKPGKEPGFLASIFLGIFNTLAKFVLAFVIGTGAGAIACWYYGIPLVFSLVGGFIVLGLALAIATDSPFS